jgi:hypothetical protein
MDGLVPCCMCFWRVFCFSTSEGTKPWCRKCQANDKSDSRNSPRQNVPKLCLKAKKTCPQNRLKNTGCKGIHAIERPGFAVDPIFQMKEENSVFNGH